VEVTKTEIKFNEEEAREQVETGKTTIRAFIVALNFTIAGLRNGSASRDMAIQLLDLCKIHFETLLASGDELLNKIREDGGEYDDVIARMNNTLKSMN